MSIIAECTCGQSISGFCNGKEEDCHANFPGTSDYGTPVPMTEVKIQTAYPIAHNYDVLSHGMLLIDHFAGLALQGHLALSIDFHDNGTPEQLAERCYKYATAMMKERDKHI